MNGLSWVKPTMSLAQKLGLAAALALVVWFLLRGAIMILSPAMWCRLRKTKLLNQQSILEIRLMGLSYVATAVLFAFIFIIPIVKALPKS